MAKREQIRKSANQRDQTDIQDTPAASRQGDELKAEFDELLDEIDEVLESNAEDFVKSYIQKGGQ
ncbi:ubiquitin-like protein Pup [Candidatus Poriferisocius sp.]|uniref:ubiquitin-like protein Pup n=1 Tax=Candidatus Poriferisocius sp. TaxID=3101276 RepID=UPI003B01245E